LSQAIALSHQSAQILQEFRERYGLKITPAWLLQLQAVAAGILVLTIILRRNHGGFIESVSEI
jgi:hypothetical protein